MLSDCICIMMLMATDLQLAWASGFLDGAGRILYSRNLVGLKVGSGDLDVLVNFRTIAGFGKIREHKGSPSFFEWTLSRQKDCRELMILFWPYLSDRLKSRWNRVLEMRELAFYPRTCPSCEKEYKPIRQAQVCCSSKCATKHIRNKERK